MFSTSSVPNSARFTGELPAASPPAEMSLIQLPTGVTHRNAAFAYRGGSFFDKRDLSMTALLVKHPRGDLLIDTGFGRHIDTQFRTMPLFFRAVTSYQRTRSASEQLDAVGYDRKGLRAILLTHAHWDHVSGVSDFPETPVWVTREELRFVKDGGWLTALIRSFPGVRYVEYEFEGDAYLGFPRGHDVYGDGAIVIVPAPGHTPGSVVVFLTLPDGKRYAMIGDIAWQREGVIDRKERPWLQRKLGDWDPAQVRKGLMQMAAIGERFPGISMVPAHDARGFEGIPKLECGGPCQ
jgi:glyoxylase-like metal-dependent hydrolase (beta-lactamase superfamily II)